ncbi:unnamed protein product, partial [Iphiclides podalirius]
MALPNGTETPDSIENFYASKSVFITGGTGFLGKILVEKLLYSCPNIDKIFLLIREKQKSDARERIKQLVNLPVFHRLQKERPEDLKKVVPVLGDLILPNLGICEEDERLLIDKVFVFVSTAYSNTDRAVLEEVVYPPPASIDEVYKIIEQGCSNAVQTSNLLSCRPNTYTFVKALTETLVKEEHGNVPSIIIRPSIVSASWNEPVRGWVDHWYGATGLLTTVAKGANRILLSRKSNILDLIPVDYVTNLTIVAAARANGSKDVLVYNSCTGAVNALTMGEVSHLIIDYSINNNFSFIGDCWLRLFGKLPRFMKMHAKVIQIRDTLQYFTSHSWVMRCTRAQELFASLSSTDRSRFPFEPTQIVWSTYIPTYFMGIREYLLKEKTR